MKNSILMARMILGKIGEDLAEDVEQSKVDIGKIYISVQLLVLTSKANSIVSRLTEYCAGQEELLRIEHYDYSVKDTLGESHKTISFSLKVNQEDW